MATQTATLQATKTAAPAGPQSVSKTTGNATNSVQAYSSTNQIWFAFEIGSGSATLNVNFNGQTYPNVPPGSYQVGHTPGPPPTLDDTQNGRATHAWAAA